MAKPTLATTPRGQEFRPSVGGLPPRAYAPSTMARNLTLILLVAVGVYFLMPIMWMIIASSKSNRDLLATFGFWFAELNWDANWTSLMSWTQNLFPRWVLNSMFYSTVAAAVGTLISVACGYAIAKFAFPGRRALLVVIMTGLLMPIALLTVPLYRAAGHLEEPVPWSRRRPAAPRGWRASAGSRCSPARAQPKRSHPARSSGTSWSRWSPVSWVVLADAQHLPQGRRQAGDRHLNFHETRDNLGTRCWSRTRTRSWGIWRIVTTRRGRSVATGTG